MTGKLLFREAHNPCHTRCSWYPAPPARGAPIETAISWCALASEGRVAPAPGARIETAILRCALASEVRVAPAPGARIETAISRCALAGEVRVAPAPGARIETAISRCALASEVRGRPRARGADWNGFFLKDDQDELEAAPGPYPTSTLVGAGSEDRSSRLPPIFRFFHPAKFPSPVFHFVASCMARPGWRARPHRSTNPSSLTPSG
jgi:hypothetical protein